ncbi:MAG: NUDIX domain-containing protein [Lachnospiraceae bacterium]|jgi:NAD+ diphosphatase|nr:NUDIX domain-containing protein [Lachnospiraceae bacterium]
MNFTYCPHCGEKLIPREIGDEGMIPYCQTCKKPLFPFFYTCTINLVVNEYKEIALIRQDYVSTENYVCVAGYMKPGESAELSACREIKEELGLAVQSLQFIRSYPLEQKSLLMLGFAARVKKDDFRLSCEVDSACWFPFEEAVKRVRPGSVAAQLLEEGFAACS